MSSQRKTTIKTEFGHTHIIDNDKYALQTSLDRFGNTVDLFQGRLLHCTDGPAVIRSDGKEFYYLYGMRLNKEQFEQDKALAVHYYQMPGRGLQRVWKSSVTGKMHRLNGPAIETSDQSYTAWMYNGVQHRIGGPAIIRARGHTTEELYYSYGKLHNSSGPAKINHSTGRSSYYLHGKRVSKENFEKRRPHLANQLRQSVSRKEALYKIYMDAAKKFHTGTSLEEYDPGSYDFIEDLISTAANLQESAQLRAAALGVYHVATGNLMIESEFRDVFQDIDDGLPPIYVMDSGEKLEPYTLYLTTFLLREFEPAAVFTAIDPDKMTMDIINIAISDSASNDRPCGYSDFHSKVDPGGDNMRSAHESSLADTHSMNAQSTEASDDSISWTAPLVLAMGATILNSLYSAKPKKLNDIDKHKNNQVMQTK
jgi:hypothetical protein